MSVVEIREPWLPTVEVEGAWVGRGHGFAPVRLSYLVHTDGLRDGGRAAVHTGPCAQDAAHAVLWHLCPDTVEMAEDGALRAARWLPSACPAGGLTGAVVVSWPRCCALRWRASGEGSAKVE